MVTRRADDGDGEAVDVWDWEVWEVWESGREQHAETAGGRLASVEGLVIQVRNIGGRVVRRKE